MPPVAPITAAALPVVRLGGDRSATRGLPGAPRVSRRLTAIELEELVAIGRRNERGQWPLDGDLRDARNMHAANRLGELRSGLDGDFDWLEVDVRLVDGAPIASHDRRIPGDALLLRDWIRVAAATGRGMKLDFKERGSIAPTLDLVADARVPQERLVINVPVLDDRGLTVEQLRRIRRRFPRAMINLSLGSDPYSSARLRDAVRLARRVGGRIAFPIDLARVDRRVVEELRRGGRVAVWNDPRRTPVADAAVTRRYLRGLGVDGTIDLR